MSGFAQGEAWYACLNSSFHSKINKLEIIPFLVIAVYFLLVSSRVKILSN